MEDSLTSGRIRIVCAPEAKSVVQRQVEAFQTLYPDSKFELEVAPSRNAVSALFANTADLAVITRDLEVDERSAAVRGGLELEGFRFGGDALVIIVNAENPVENLAIDEVRALYDGTVKEWADLGGARAAVVPVIQPPEADMTAFFSQRVMGGDPIRVRPIYAPDDSAVVAAVRARRDAVGFVSLAAPDDGVRALRIAPLKGLPYWKPDPETVHGGDYPLTRYYQYYLRTAGRRLAHGLVTYGTSFEGQKLVHERGLVPTAVPVRFVRRSPMMSTH